MEVCRDNSTNSIKYCLNIALNQLICGFKIVLFIAVLKLIV
nr:MAG TPA: hypothetical protein [Caudoviricetes sp.]